MCHVFIHALKLPNSKRLCQLSLLQQRRRTFQDEGATSAYLICPEKDISILLNNVETEADCFEIILIA